jgi:hypothetical protein
MASTRSCDFMPIVRGMLDIAHDIGGGRCAHVLLLRGNTFWTSSQLDAAAASFEAATRVAASAREAGVPTSNLAVLAMDRGDPTTALHLSRMSIEYDPGARFLRANRLVWCHFLGRDAEAQVLLSRLAETPLDPVAAEVLRPDSIRRYGNFLAEVLVIPKQRRHRLIRDLLRGVGMLQATRAETVSEVRWTDGPRSN